MKIVKALCFAVGFSFLFAGRLCSAPTAKALLKKRLLGYRQDPAFRAFLDVLAYAEGTYNALTMGYMLKYPNSKFESWKTHPGMHEFINSRGIERRSSAAGRYMILERIWDKVACNIDLHDFSPLNQDLAALYLINEKCGASTAIKNLDVEKASNAVNGIWATLPNSPHEQVTTNMHQIKKFFKTRYDHYKIYLNKNSLTTVAGPKGQKKL